MSRTAWVLAAGVVVVGAGLAVAFLPRGGGKEPGFRTEAVQRGNIVVQASATGTLNAVTTVQVGSQVSGTIQGLNADFNDRVRQGQVLAQLDPTFLKAQVAQSEADLERARVEVHKAELDLNRVAPMREKGLTSQAEVDAAETTLEAARASTRAAEAAVDRARTNLRYATITSPIEGIVVSRNVDVGQTVAASLSAPTLFTIANDLARMQLEAAVDEADIGMIKVGQKVSFTVDAFPDRSFDGAVRQIRLAPQTVQNVVSYIVIVDVGNPDQILLPGMTANATFLVDEIHDVLRVPATALRFRPPMADGGRGSAAAASRPGASEGGPGHGGAGPGGGMHAGRAGRGGAPGVYVLADDGSLRRVAVTPGLSDGTFTAVASDSLAEGMMVVVGLNGGTAAAGQGTVNPFAPGGMGRSGRR